MKQSSSPTLNSLIVTSLAIALSFFLALYLYSFLPTRLTAVVRSAAVFIVFAMILLSMAYLGIFLLKVIFRSKDSKKSRLSNASIYMLTISSAFISLLVISTIIGPMMPRPLPPHSFDLSFDSQEWKGYSWKGKPHNEYASLRQKMLGDVLENELYNKTQHEIVNALGEPLNVYHSDNGKVHLEYVLGKSRTSFFFPDTEYLSIWFDEDGQILNHRLIVDS